MEPLLMYETEADEVIKMARINRNTIFKISIPLENKYFLLWPGFGWLMSDGSWKQIDIKED